MPPLWLRAEDGQPTHARIAPELGPVLPHQTRSEARQGSTVSENHFEEEARGLKVAKLVEALDARFAGLESEVLLGDPEACRFMAKLLRDTPGPEAFWTLLASDAGVNLPSAETRERVARVYDRRAREASE